MVSLCAGLVRSKPRPTSLFVLFSHPKNTSVDTTYGFPTVEYDHPASEARIFLVSTDSGYVTAGYPIAKVSQSELRASHSSFLSAASLLLIVCKRSWLPWAVPAAPSLFIADGVRL